MKSQANCVLVVTAQPEITSQLQRIFAMERSFHIQYSNSCREALSIAGRENQELDIVLVDEAIMDASSLETIRRLALLLPSVPIVSLAGQNAVSYVREALLAGARAFITKPLSESDVITTVNQLLQLESARRGQAREKNGSQKQRCRVITVTSPKGGVGTTMLAANLAVSLRERTGKEVVLLDGQASMGDLDPALNLQAKYSCADLLGHGAHLDAELVYSVLATHTSGLKVLVSSQNLEDADYVTRDVMDRIIDFLRRAADYLIIDAGSPFEEQTSSVLEAADDVLMVATPEITTLRRCTYFLNAAEESGFPRHKIQLVVNREGMAGGLSTEDISQHLNMRVLTSIPDDGGLVVYAFNRGIPLVASNPRSALARQIGKLADTLTPEVHAREGGGQNLFGRLSTMLRSNPA